ncbi:MAG: hypothetical protein A2Y41_04625 [Spirochaetes bacterium GWB1_36_13]|nr:MAG: hypothetical protein A2Y41_04625 [Spirochaetes bacterium GWB1_36_13]
MEVKRIGKYQIADKIAEGGMGVIYKSIDLDTEKVVAIKTLKDSIDIHNETFIRFKKEAELLESLHHPNILHFIDFIEKDAQVFIVTEYLQGSNLKQIIQSDTLSLDQKIEIVKEIAEALDYVHSQGIIHRDIKPSNIIVTEVNKPKILDFGVANLIDFQKIFSNKEGVVGSFAYMSPEQSGILKRNIDNRSDLYSLGILFYELMTGILPYQAKEVGELIHQHIAKMPDEPIDINKNISPIVNKIILKLIKKDPDDRYQTAYGLAEDLKIYLSLSEEQKNTFYLELGKKDRLKNLNYRTSLIGRKTELKALLNNLNNTVLGKGSLAVLIGKSGLGKSRLMAEVQKYTNSKNAFYTGVVSSERSQNQPYFPFSETVKKILDFLSKYPERIKKEIYSKIKKTLGEEGKILSKVIPELSFILGKFDPAMKFSRKENEVFFEKLKDFFVSIASPSTPLVMTLDDVHFWDQGSVQFLSYLLKCIDSESIFLLLAMREEETQNQKELYNLFVSAAKDGKINIINLGNLNSEEVEDLILEIFGTIYTGVKEISARINEATQGNPLLIIENVKTLVEEGIIVQKNEGWSVNLDKLTLFKFSSSIVDRILNRLSKIKPETRNILSFAAVLGKDFEFHILFKVIEKNEHSFKKELLLEQLREGIEAQLVLESLSEKGEIRYSFAHDKVIETLLSQLSDKQLKETHRNAAEIIEKEYKEQDKVYKLAYHYLMGDRRNKAYAYNNMAGKKAIESFSYKLAVSFFYKSLSIIRKFAQKTHKAVKERIKLSMEIVTLNFQLGDLQENILLLDEIANLADEMDMKEDLASIYYWTAKTYYFLGNQPKAMEYYYKVIPIAESLNMPELLAIPYAAIGRANCFIANFTEAVDYIQKGLAILPKTEVLEYIYSVGILSQALAALGYREEALHAVDQLKTDFGEIENEMFKLYVQFFYACVYAMIGEPEIGLKECQKSYDMARELKNPSIEFNALFNMGRAYAAMGKIEEAIKNVSKAVNISKEHNISVGLAMIIFNLAEYYALIGNVRMARDTLIDGEKYVGISNPDLMQQWKLRLEALFELFSHTPTLFNALSLIDTALEITDKMGDGYYYFTINNKLVKAAILWKMDRISEGDELFQEVMKYFNEHALQNDIRYAERLEGHFSPHVQRTENKSGHDKIFDASSTFTMTSTQTEFSYQRQLKYLLKLSEQISKVHEMDTLLPKIMSLAIEVSGAERGILFLYENPDDSASELFIRAKKSVDSKEEKGEIIYSEAIVRKTLETKNGELIIDAEKELEGDELVQKYNMKSIITVPLITSGKTLGVIYLDNRQVKGLFTEENFELLKAFATQSAISIENAKLYLQVQEKARAEQEMEIAKDIQLSILPFVKDTDFYEIAAFMQTATEVGGDYYDLFLKEAPYFGVFGDVSGHGLKSGLIMMMAEVAFNALMKDDYSRKKPIQNIYQQINETLYENIQERLSLKSSIGNQYSHMYMTFRMFRFDDDGNFEMFGNDHAEPFVFRSKTNEVEEISSSGFLIGMMKDAIMGNDSYSFHLETGDMLILYSDGITEAKNEAKKKISRKNEERLMYGEERLYDVIRENKDKKPEEIIQAVIASVDQWMMEQEDDITIMILKKK